MLTGTNNYNLSRKGLQNGEIFFYQRWKELLESRTLDMYQYNILNSCVAVFELLDVIDKTIDGLFTSRQNVDDCKAETLEILKNDDILEDNNKALSNSLKRIVSSKIDSKSKVENPDDKNNNFYISLKRLKSQLSFSARKLGEEYCTYIINQLKKDIEQNDHLNMDKHMSFLISQCISEGWSAKGLTILSKHFECESSFEEKWNNFTQKILSNQTDSFDVCYSLKIETKKGTPPDAVRQTIRDMGIDIRKGEAIKDDYNHIPGEICNLLKTDTHYAVVRVQAKDSTAAALNAINLLNNKINVATFYNIINPWVANLPTIIIHNNSTNYSESMYITDVFKTYDYIDSSNNIFEDTRKTINDPEKIIVSHRLRAVFLYTNLSRSSVFQETKFISLWIALESIMRTGQYSDIISHIKKVLPTALCTRYVYKIIRNFSEDCIRCGIKSIQDSLNINFEDTNKKLMVKSLIGILRDDEKYQQLALKCQCNDLLKYRCNEIYKILNDNKAITTKLEHYKTKVEWHIQRLYRVRNEITHSAYQNDKSLVIYIEHLYTYLSQLISEIVYYLEHKNANSIEEVYALLGENYETFMELLKSNTIDNKVVLTDGVIDIF